jgi:alpha-beta hydrolase superfamily lysophospholipase
MSQALRSWIAQSLTIVLVIVAPAVAAQSPAGIGIVVMHGKGGSPERNVQELASFLEGKGYAVANLEMPWSGRREYDVSVDAAEKEVQSAFEALRGRGAKKLFLAGHSQGALFAIHYAGKHPVDGVVAIAPGGSVSTPVFRRELGESVGRARRLMSEGKADEKTRLMDYEGSRGTNPVFTTPAVYLTWFDPEGAMSLLRAAKSVKAGVPVLYVGPTGDYPNLLKGKAVVFGALPAHPLTKLHEPDSSHLDAPSASREEILRWTSQVASGN